MYIFIYQRMYTGNVPLRSRNWDRNNQKKNVCKIGTLQSTKGFKKSAICLLKM
jgi:hypothetical protein